MSDILNKTIVLVLNRNWQAINIRKPADAFCQMATNAATALDIELGPGAAAEAVRAQALRPVTWDEWITLPIRDGNRCQYTGHLLHPDEGNLDQVVPRSRGGEDTWKTWCGRASR